VDAERRAHQQAQTATHELVLSLPPDIREPISNQTNPFGGPEADVMGSIVRRVPSPTWDEDADVPVDEVCWCVGVCWCVVDEVCC